MEKFVLVAYDIPETKERNELIEVLEYYGMFRVQFSVFLGFITTGYFQEMVTTLKVRFFAHENKVLIIDLCKSCSSSLISYNYKIPDKREDYLVL